MKKGNIVKDSNEYKDSSYLELREPSRDSGLLEVFRRKYLLGLLVKKATKTKFRGSFLGVFWTYIKPLWLFFMYWFVMGTVMGRGTTIYDYPVYLLSGMTVVKFFSDVFSSTTSCISSNKGLIKKIYLPRELFAVATLRNSITLFYPQALILYIVAAILILIRDPSNFFLLYPDHIIAAVLAFVIISIFGMGIGMVFACLNVFYKDSENVADLITVSIMWVSPIMYEASIMAHRLKGIIFDIYMSSPIAVCAELFHFAVTNNPKFNGDTSNPMHFNLNSKFLVYTIIALLISIAFLALGQFMFKHYEGKFAKRL